MNDDDSDDYDMRTRRKKEERSIFQGTNLAHSATATRLPSSVAVLGFLAWASHPFSNGDELLGTVSLPMPREKPPPVTTSSSLHSTAAVPARLEAQLLHLIFSR